VAKLRCHCLENPARFRRYLGTDSITWEQYELGVH
jgi:hypothetical protein